MTYVWLTKIKKSSTGIAGVTFFRHGRPSANSKANMIMFYLSRPTVKQASVSVLQNFSFDKKMDVIACATTTCKNMRRIFLLL